MSYADDVRLHVNTHYIKPARSHGDSEVEILTGVVHKALGYRNRYPLVCAALGSQIFENTYRVRRVAVEGPLNGASTLFRFRVLA